MEITKETTDTLESGRRSSGPQSSELESSSPSAVSQLTVVFDSECDMCIHFANVLDGWRVATLPYQDLSPQDPLLAYNPRDRLVVIRDGLIATGPLAVLEIARDKYPKLNWLWCRVGSGWPLALSGAVYEAIAKRRHLIVRLFCAPLLKGAIPSLGLRPPNRQLTKKSPHSGKSN